MLTIADLFKMQSTLNERLGLDDKKFADVFSVPGQQTNYQEYRAAKLDAGKWIDDMLKAMSSEMEELRNCTYWKHWCSEAQDGRRYEIKDVESARKEVIDMLHFWINLAQILGMSPEMVCGMYSGKLAKNIKRQDDGYSIEVKDLAWQLRQEHPDQCPVPYPLAAKSLEEMPDEAAQYYLDLAKAAGEGVPCQYPSLRGKGCKFCGQKDCDARQYLSTLRSKDDGYSIYKKWSEPTSFEDLLEAKQSYCECLDTKFNDGPKEETASMLPEPDPDCEKCGGTGYES